MPDIGTLPKLSEIFNKSIDDILAGGEHPSNKEREKGRVIARLAQNRLNEVKEMINSGDIEVQSVVDIAPILKPSMVDEIVQEANEIGIEQLYSLAPFLSSDTLSKIADRVIDKSVDAHYIVGLAPFVDVDSIIDKVAEGNINEHVICGLAPFLSSESIGKLIHRVNGGKIRAETLLTIAPFLDQYIGWPCSFYGQ